MIDDGAELLVFLAAVFAFLELVLGGNKWR